MSLGIHYINKFLHIKAPRYTGKISDRCRRQKTITIMAEHFDQNINKIAICATATSKLKILNIFNGTHLFCTDPS